MVFQAYKIHGLRCLRKVFVVYAILIGLLFSTPSMALDAPSNIRLEDGRLVWDPVSGANEYHVYYFNGPVPSESIVGNFLINTGGTSWPLAAANAPFGYYTVVSVQTFGGPEPVEYSAVTDGGIAPYLSNSQSSNTSPKLIGSGQLQSYYPGDDGDKNAGLNATGDRYILNNDGTFIDTLTNLIWIADGNCIPLADWVASIDYANNLSGDGTSGCTNLSDGSNVGDWRLPNIVELLSLYDYSVALGFSGVPLANLSGPLAASDFWSATSFGSAATPNDVGLAWEVKFISDPDTGSRIDQKSNSGRAWAVRDQK